MNNNWDYSPLYRMWKNQDAQAVKSNQNTNPARRGNGSYPPNIRPSPRPRNQAPRPTIILPPQMALSWTGIVAVGHRRCHRALADTPHVHLGDNNSGEAAVPRRLQREGRREVHGLPLLLQEMMQGCRFFMISFFTDKPDFAVVVQRYLVLFRHAHFILTCILCNTNWKE